MDETYTSLGLEASWTFGAAIALGSIVGVIWQSVRAKKLTIQPAIIGAFSIGLVLALWQTPIPMLWAIPGLSTIGAIAVFFMKHKNMKNRVGMGVTGIAVSVALFFIMQSMFTGVVVLGDENVTWDSWVDDSGHVPREGLRVHATGSPKRWYGNRQWWSWTIYSDSATTPSERLGPHLIGFELYWGPDGMVTGDELGVRLAEWAGVEPRYRMTEN
ncbi:MAG: hypothetical protein IH944_07530 [Armatimonadetes bacterium]|nr:hypothetical protein [Armatimonadota bacterium]